MLRRVPGQVLDNLAGAPLFAACTRAELRSIARLGTKVAVTDGTIITRPDKAGFEVILVIAGKARCLVEGTQVAVSRPGDFFFGDIALLDGGPRQATVIADGQLQLLELDGSEFGSLLNIAPSVSHKLLTSIARGHGDGGAGVREPRRPQHPSGSGTESVASPG
jgi:CRP-like cAMP-binding protein